MTIGFIELERRVKALEDRLAGQRKSLTFLDPKCNIPCTASLEQKIERLIAYFERHSRENQKRSEKLDKELQTTLMSCTDYKRNEHSSYYLSGKADAYARAAEKLREVLGKPNWIVEVNTYSDGWVRSKDVPYTYTREACARQAIEEAEKRFGNGMDRRARRFE